MTQIKIEAATRLIATAITPNQMQKLKSALRDTQRFIAKEAPRAADIRPDNVAKLLAWYYQHEAFLEAVIASGDIDNLTDPKFKAKYFK